VKFRGGALLTLATALVIAPQPFFTHVPLKTTFQNFAAHLDPNANNTLHDLFWVFPLF